MKLGKSIKGISAAVVVSAAITGCSAQGDVFESPSEMMAEVARAGYICVDRTMEENDGWTSVLCGESTYFFYTPGIDADEVWRKYADGLVLALGVAWPDLAEQTEPSFPLIIGNGFRVEFRGEETWGEAEKLRDIGGVLKYISYADANSPKDQWSKVESRR